QHAAARHASLVTWTCDSPAVGFRISACRGWMPGVEYRTLNAGAPLLSAFGKVEPVCAMLRLAYSMLLASTLSAGCIPRTSGADATGCVLRRSGVCSASLLLREVLRDSPAR